MHADDVEARLAAQLVRRMCCQHECEGRQCTDRNHRRDENLVRDHLQMLGLGEDLDSVSTEERQEWFANYATSRKHIKDLEQLVV